MSNNTIKKIVEQVYKGHQFTTNDLISFNYESKKGLLTIDNHNGDLIYVDMTQHSMEMLYKFFKYVLEDNGDQHGK